MTLRKYKSSDLGEITELFYNTVHTVNARDYSTEQLDAWADGNPDTERWNRTLSDHYTVVACENGKIVGFGDIDETGYLDRLYVHAEFQRKGIGSAICDALEDKAACDILTYASITARPFFEKRGYKVLEKRQVERHGVFLTNFAMKKHCKSAEIQNR